MLPTGDRNGGITLKLLVLDGNSIVNRAFYAIKALTTKNGQFTNAIYGFLNILLHLEQTCEPDCVAVAFDLKAPTFRHKMYAEYKAGRKGMPDELAQQMPVLKELLAALGYTIVSCEGWEADDILGTLSDACRGTENQCFLATGDRDSLQLVGGNTVVLLAATRSGQAQTVYCDEARIQEDYGVQPPQLIEVKALQGDTSDNIPGVKGIGEKTALDLIQRFGNIDYIYDHLDTLEIRDSVRKRLAEGKDSAYMSRTLGTIRADAPISKNIEDYRKRQPDAVHASQIFASLEMFKMIDRFGLDAQAPAVPAEQEQPQETLELKEFDSVQISEGQAVYLYNAGEACYLIAGSALCPLSTEQLLALLMDSAVPKYVFDSKSAHALALRHGCEVENLVFDLSLAGYLLNPSSSNYSVKRLAAEYQVVSPMISGGEADEEAVSFRAVCERVEHVLEENGQRALLDQIELPLARVLAEMEHDGFEVDRDGIETFGKKLEEEIEQLKAGIFEQVGFEFNLNSPKQLGEALFDKLGLPAKKKTKTGYSTNAEVLESLAVDYPVVADILNYRTLAKLKSTYCDGLLKVIAPDGRIHSSLNQTETRTGRISSSEPNLQNIPVRKPVGREMRRFFRAREGCVLVDSDYSQIELRVLAHMANDRNMIDAFNSGTDIHTVTASQVFNMPVQMVTPLMRSNAKAVNFGIVYGIGAFSLAKDINVTRKEAAAYIDSYLSHYSGVRDYMERVVAQAKADGYVTTLFGRRRYLPELKASNAVTRAFGERVARNMPIQGTAADIIKIAMIRVRDRLKKEQLQSRLILQVHDELIVEAPETEREQVEQIVREEMEHACEMQVKLEADVHSGKTWYDAKE